MHSLQLSQIVNPGLLHHASVAEKKAKQRCIRKADTKSAFMCTLQRLESRDLKLVYTDGSSKWNDMQGYIGGIGVFVENELSLSLYNPPLLGQTNQAAELLAVQTMLTMFCHQNIAIITLVTGSSKGPPAGPTNGKREDGYPTRVPSPILSFGIHSCTP